MEDIFQMEENGCKDQELWKMFGRKSIPERGRCFSIVLTTLSGAVAVDEQRFVVATRNSAWEKGEQKEI